MGWGRGAAVAWASCVRLQASNLCVWVDGWEGGGLPGGWMDGWAAGRLAGLKGERVGGWGGVGMGQPVTRAFATGTLRNEKHVVFAKQISPLTGQSGD